MKKEDFSNLLHSISNTAKDFAAEMTSVNVQAKNLQDASLIAQEYSDNNTAVRQMLAQRGIALKNI